MRKIIIQNKGLTRGQGAVSQAWQECLLSHLAFHSSWFITKMKEIMSPKMRSLSHIWNGWPEIGHTLTLVLNVQLFTKRRECKSRCNFVGAGGFDIGRAHFLANSPQFSWILMLYIRSGEVQFQNKPLNYRGWNLWNLVSSEPGELDGWHISLLNHLNTIILRLVIQIQSRKKRLAPNILYGWFHLKQVEVEEKDIG